MVGQRETRVDERGDIVIMINEEHLEARPGGNDEDSSYMYMDTVTCINIHV